jgi:hypothetical protein
MAETSGNLRERPYLSKILFAYLCARISGPKPPDFAQRVLPQITRIFADFDQPLAKSSQRKKFE